MSLPGFDPSVIELKFNLSRSQALRTANVWVITFMLNSPNAVDELFRFGLSITRFASVSHNLQLPAPERRLLHWRGHLVDLRSSLEMLTTPFLFNSRVPHDWGRMPGMRA